MMKTISVTPTISAVVYAAGDAVGGLLEFEMAVPYAGKPARIVGVTVIDKANVRAALDIVLFDRTFTASADQAAFNPSDADIVNSIGVVSVAAADYADLGLNAVATKRDLNLSFVPLGTSLFGQIVTRGTPTYGATDALVVELTVELV